MALFYIFTNLLNREVNSHVHMLLQSIAMKVFLVEDYKENLASHRDVAGMGGTFQYSFLMFLDSFVWYFTKIQQVKQDS